MKKFPVWIIGLALFTLNAPAQVQSEQDFLETEAARRAREVPLKMAKPNEIRVDPISYDGILIEVVVVDNPLQLINPGAGPQYGNPEDNLVRDPISGRASGLKLLSLQF
jgi:hypothetical protein